MRAKMRMNVNQQKEKIEEFVKRGEEIKAQEKHVPEKGFFMCDYVSGPMFDQWINEINIFNERYLKKHQLYEQIKNACIKYKKLFSPCDDIIGYLKTILVDGEFWDDQIGDINNTQNSEISDEAERMLSSLLDMHFCDGEIYLEDNDSRIKDIPNYEKALKRLNAEGFFITYKPDVIGGYEIELSEKALAYHKSQKHKKEPTTNVTNIYISGDVNSSNLSTGTNSNQSLTNANQNQFSDKKHGLKNTGFRL